MTPSRVAVALARRLGVHESVREQLMQMERDAEELRGRLRNDALQVDPLLLRTRELVASRVDAFLDAPGHGALPAALACLDRLEPGGTVFNALVMSWQRCRGAAERFVALNDELCALRLELAELDAYEQLPWHVAEVRSAFELERLATSTAPFVQSKRAALAVARSRLDAMQARSNSPPQTVQGRWPAEVSRQEVTAALGTLVWDPFVPLPVLRRRRLRDLSDAVLGTWADAALDERQSTWETRLALEVLRRSQDGHGAGSDDLDARTLLLRAGVASPPRGVVAGVTMAAVDTNPIDGFGVRRIFGPYVVIRAGARSPAVLSTNDIKLGATATVTLQLPPTEAALGLPFDRWGEGLFEEPDGGLTAFIAVSTRGKVKIEGQVDSQTWLGRITRRGKLVTASGPGPEVVPLRNASAFLPKVVPLGTTPMVVTRRRFGGLIVQDAEVPVEDHHMVELHTAASVRDAGRLEDERKFFLVATRYLGGLASRPVGLDDRSGGYCYAPLAAIRIRESATLVKLRDHDPMLLVRAVVRTWDRLMRAPGGLALGLYHEDAFSFRVVAGPGGSGRTEAELEAVINLAPAGRQFEERYPEAHMSDGIHHRRLGGPDLQRLVSEQGYANGETEAALAILFVLELLAKYRIDSPQCSLRELGQFIHAVGKDRPHEFHYPDVVERLTHALIDPASRPSAVLEELI